MALVAAELVGANSGLGFLINDARSMLRTDTIFVGMLTIGVVGLLIDTAIRVLAAISAMVVGTQQVSSRDGPSRDQEFVQDLRRPRRAGNVVALRDVTFEVPNHQFCAILGHSGCGKTTFSTLRRVSNPHDRHYRCRRCPIRVPGWQNTMIFQDYALFPWMDVSPEHCVRSGDESYHAQARRSRTTLIWSGLSALKKVSASTLGDMRQRVAIARALAVQPHLLLMDEPFAALDAQNRAFMQDELVRIWQREPKTVVLVTHSIDEAIKLSDCIAVMNWRPGRVKEFINVNLPRPRDEDDIAYLQLRRRLRDLIHEEV